MEKSIASIIHEALLDVYILYGDVSIKKHKGIPRNGKYIRYGVYADLHDAAIRAAKEIKEIIK